MVIKGVFLCLFAFAIKEISSATSPGDLHKLYKYTNKHFEKKDKLLDHFLNKQIHFHIQDHHFHHNHEEKDNKKEQHHGNDHHHNHYTSYHHDHRYGHHKDHHKHHEDTHYKPQKDNQTETKQSTTKAPTTTNNSNFFDISVSNTEKIISANQLSSLSDSYNLLQRALEASTSDSSTPHPIEYTRNKLNVDEKPPFRPLPDYNIGEFINNYVLSN